MSIYENEKFQNQNIYPNLARAWHPDLNYLSPTLIFELLDAVGIEISINQLESGQPRTGESFLTCQHWRICDKQKVWINFTEINFIQVLGLWESRAHLTLWCYEKWEFYQPLYYPITKKELRIIRNYITTDFHIRNFFFSIFNFLF